MGKPRGTWKERVGVLTVGLLANHLMVWSFDFGFYPFVVYQLGPLKGGVVMSFLSLVYCYATILFYDWSKQDWLGIETIKARRDGDEEPIGRIERMSRWALRKGDGVALVVLSILQDPFITVAYMRRGAFQYNGLTARDWKLFLGSWAIGNIYWTLASWLGVSVLEWIWIHLKGLVA